MAKKRSGRLVYSTETGAGACPRCGWPTKQCRCSQPADEAVPETIVARLSLERYGRKGKTVTVVGGLPRNREFLSRLARELKQACGSGGSTGEGRVEIQGDQREAIRKLLETRGWKVKGG